MGVGFGGRLAGRDGDRVVAGAGYVDCGERGHCGPLRALEWVFQGDRGEYVRFLLLRDPMTEYLEFYGGMLGLRGGILIFGVELASAGRCG